MAARCGEGSEPGVLPLPSSGAMLELMSQVPPPAGGCGPLQDPTVPMPPLDSVGSFVSHLAGTLEVQLSALHEHMARNLVRENQMLRHRLTAADDLLRRLLKDGDVTLSEYNLLRGPVMGPTCKPLEATLRRNDEVPLAESVFLNGQARASPRPASGDAAAGSVPVVQVQGDAGQEEAMIHFHSELPTMMEGVEELPHAQARPRAATASGTTPPASPRSPKSRRGRSRSTIKSSSTTASPLIGPAQAAELRAEAAQDERVEELPEVELQPTEIPQELAKGEPHGPGGILSPEAKTIMKQHTSRGSMLWRRWEMASEQSHRQRSCLKNFVTSNFFEAAIATTILANCGTMSLDAHIAVVDSYPKFLEQVLVVADNLFTSIFCAEFLLKWKVFGLRFFWPSTVDGRWNFMDMCLMLFTGVLFTWLMPLLGYIFNLDLQSKVLRTFGVLRTARLARLVRVAQKVSLFKEAWMLIRGLGDSTRTLFWTCIVICFVTYIFAIFGLLAIVANLKDEYRVMQAMGDLDPELVEQREQLAEVLGIVTGMDQLMFTLIQVLMGDSYHAITRPIMYFIPWSWMYFYAYIAVAVLVLMNLVTAIIVDNALSNSRLDEDAEIKQKEAAKDRDIAELKKLFELMDADGSGTLSWDEFKDSFDDAEMSKKWMLLDFQPEECKELFSLLDDGDGEIETEEFFDGLGRMKGMAQSKDIFRLQKDINCLKGQIEELFEDLTTRRGVSKDPGAQAEAQERPSAAERQSDPGAQDVPSSSA